MDLYRENLLDHYKNPRNFGKPDWQGQYMWEEMNPSCGDKIGIALKIEEERGPASSRLRGTNNLDKLIVKDIRFWGEGCVVSMASASMLTEKIKEIKSLKLLKSLKGDDILEMLGGKEMIPPARLRCAFLSLEALRRALGKV